MTLPKHIRLVRKGLPGTNTLAYLRKFVKYGEKSFITLAQVFPILENDAKFGQDEKRVFNCPFFRPGGGGKGDIRAKR